MSHYKTEQKESVISFLTKYHDNQFTIDQIVEGIRQECQGMDPEQAVRLPGKSTVYRLINTMVDEGMVRRIADEDSKRFFYQLSPSERCKTHLHLKCINCGQLIHVDQAVTQQMEAAIQEQFHFSVDEEKTMLFGRCQQCETGAKPEKEGC